MLRLSIFGSRCSGRGLWGRLDLGVEGGRVGLARVLALRGCIGLAWDMSGTRVRC